MLRVCSFLLLFLPTSLGCGRFAGVSADEPSVARVLVNARVEGEAAHLQIFTYGVEGDWSYGAFPQARLESLLVDSQSGVPVQTGPVTFTPSEEHGGDFIVPLPALAPTIEKLRVSGRFIGLDADGTAVLTREFKDEVAVRR